MEKINMLNLMSPNFSLLYQILSREAYLEHDYKVRQKWTIVQGEKTEDFEEDLFRPFAHLSEKGKECVHKIPLTLYINPSWNKTKFRGLIREQTDEIYRRLFSAGDIIEEMGFETIAPDDSQNIRYWKRKLKALGHFRLRNCVDLDEEYVRKWYGDDSYHDKESLDRAIKDNFPTLV